MERKHSKSIAALMCWQMAGRRGRILQACQVSRRIRPGGRGERNTCPRRLARIAPCSRENRRHRRRWSLVRVGPAVESALAAASNIIEFGASATNRIQSISVSSRERFPWICRIVPLVDARFVRHVQPTNDPSFAPGRVFGVDGFGHSSRATRARRGSFLRGNRPPLSPFKFGTPNS
jgi:hypothetical protein